MKAVDWLARTAMLVLAALATLALIGSLASVSDSPIGDAFPGQVAVQDVPTPPNPVGAASSGADATPAAGATEPTEPTGTAMVASVERAAAVRDREVARWLKALTYAVIALAAVAAAGVVALVRIGEHLARVAER